MTQKIVNVSELEKLTKHWSGKNQCWMYKVDDVRALAANSHKADDVKDGYALVPIEPTDAMLKAGCEAGIDINTLLNDELFATDKAVYKAMILAYINK